MTAQARIAIECMEGYLFLCGYLVANFSSYHAQMTYLYGTPATVKANPHANPKPLKGENINPHTRKCEIAKEPLKIANRKGPKYLYSRTWGFCIIMIWRSIPHKQYLGPFGKTHLKS